MGIGSWLKSVLSKEEQSDKLGGFTDQSLSVFRRESPQKVLETRIRPVKVPNLIDIGERLGTITKDVYAIKQKMVTKLWIQDAYDDSSIVDRLDTINESISQLENRLSNFTKPLSKKLSDPKKFEIEGSSIAESILKFLENNKGSRYKELKNALNISDPTLSKYLRRMLESGKITRSKAGKAVFYELAT